jgi:hypothetical protein
MTTRAKVAAEHLLLRLRPLNRALRYAVERQSEEAALLDRPDLTPYCIPDEQVRLLLDRVERLAVDVAVKAAPIELTDLELSAERALRENAGTTLPLDELERTLDLTALEQAAVLLCAAPEWDRGYERIYAYILDDLNRRTPCVELLCTVLALSTLDRLTLPPTFGPAGRLRRLGLLRPWGEAPTEVRQELRCAPGLVEFLTGAPVDLNTIAHDNGAMDRWVSLPPSPHIDAARVQQVGHAVLAGTVNLVGVWGPRSAGVFEVARSVAHAAGLLMRRVPPQALATADAGKAVSLALRTSSATQAMLWIPTDGLGESVYGQQVIDVLAHTSAPVCLSGTEPWRPSEVLAGRQYAEIPLDQPGYRDRVVMWSTALPGLDRSRAEGLAARYRLSNDEVRTVGALARAEAQVAGNGGAGDFDAAVERAAAAVTYRLGDGLARPVAPRRSAGDLVLPAAQQRQVAEVAAACLAWPRVAEAWGFGRHFAGHGVKALFTGEPGTGKTLAAEVIAGTLGLLLLKVDLARVVSKWVGETEKNLEAAFQQAEDSQAVLFFDEADALFGKRGDVKQGIDRYANLEVGFLLQRLEQSDAIIILASNLREQVDAAFTRRFHYVVNFPRPEREERERIWRIAFPRNAPVARDVDFATVSELDMTGASITSAARTAALLAADAGDEVITMAHVVAGIRRQYDRDARLLRPNELGPYACLAEGGGNGR